MSTSRSRIDSNCSWTFEAGSNEPDRRARPRILYLESYGSGSHLRIARLLQEWSGHQVDIIVLDRGHWRWLALTGHRHFSRAIATLGYPRPNAVICSGPADVRLIAAALPPAWGQVPLAVYFHESQWTYPGEGFDPRPYLIGHLEALESADQVWFNSRYHQRTFRRAALENPSPRLRRLARAVIADTWHKTRVLHPPVHVEASRRASCRSGFSITWAARWEWEKRPDVFVEAATVCVRAGLEPALRILGVPGGMEALEPAVPTCLRRYVSNQSGFPERRAYEQTLAETDLWVSTAEHEFFGVAAVEAALLGATPVLPRALAYPETLPSAPTYADGDPRDLARVILALHARPPRSATPWRVDASRFHAGTAAARFDALVEELLRGG